MDKYQKVRVLGKGSFGSAILIKRKVDNALFVVKEVSLLKMSKKERDEARHECTILQKLKHPNIVRYVEQFENQRSLYIVMEYCDGGDLNAKIRQSRLPMKESTIMYYFSQVCLAMEYLHSYHMLHRDIKTMNVFLMKNGAVKLGDFGITTILRNTMGMANTVCGTPYYFSPELCRNRPYNNKSDIWALGVLLYECVTCGRHPFDGNNMNQLMHRIVTVPCPAITNQYSPEFRKMVFWCLEKDPLKRPSIKQLLSLPLVRRSLEQLEENLMLATECRVRLKDIIDFEVVSPSSENSNECKGDKKTPYPAPRADQKKMKQTPGLTPGQAAAMAVVQQSPPRSSPESKPVSDILGPKPKAVNANANQNNVNHASPSKPHQRNIIDNLHQMRERLNAAALAEVAPYPRRPSSPNNRKLFQPNFEPVDRSEEITPVRDSPLFSEFQPNVQRIKAIMAKYEHNANPQAKETIHAYMRRKQEEYLKKKKEDLERRKRLNDLRDKELQCILAQQRHAALGAANNACANGYNVNNKPIKDAYSPAPLSHEARVLPQDNRAAPPLTSSPSSPSKNEYRSAAARPSLAQEGGLPLRTPGQCLERVLGLDPKFAPHIPVKAALKHNTPPLMAHQQKVKVAANSPLHVDKAACPKAKPAVGKRKEGPPPSEQPKVFPKNRYSNGNALNRLDHKAQEVVNREAGPRKYPIPRPSFAMNAEALNKGSNLLDKAATPKGGAEDAIVVTGTRVSQFRSPPIRQIRPARPAVLSALQDNRKDAERAVSHVSLPSTPTSNLKAEKRSRFSFNSELRPHVDAPVARLRKRIPSSPTLNPKSLAALPPAAPHSANGSVERGVKCLFKRLISSDEKSDSSDIQAHNLSIASFIPNRIVNAVQSSDQLVSDSNVTLVKSVENDNISLQASKASPFQPVQMSATPLKVSALETNNILDSISEAELINVAHTVKRRTPVQATPLMKMKKKNLCLSDSNSSDSTIQSKKTSQIDVKPVSHPVSDIRPHHIRWPLSDEAAKCMGILKGSDIPAAEVEFHPLKEVNEKTEKREVVMPSMLETLRTLRSKVSPHPDCTSVDHFSNQLALLKQRQRLGVERSQFINKDNDIIETNLKSNERSPEPTPEKTSSLQNSPRKKPILNIEVTSSSRCTNAERKTSVSCSSNRDLETDKRRTSLVEGYEEMLQHLRSLLEKRRVSYRNIRKINSNINDSVSRSLSPANLSDEYRGNGISSNEIKRPSFGLVSGSPPRLLNTKPRKSSRNSLLADVDELSESLHIHEDSEDLNGENDNFEDAVPLSPVRCAVRNDMYTQMLQQNIIKTTEVNAEKTDVSDILHLNDVIHSQDGMPRRGCTRC
ncbi:unnamed protein product [Phytomonas sp. Hart1]|nr:unnamed protein product [Phytomonas sp. Hart1]|eukprot:CCW70529.1 unnamed protein product [Phytomonas sp. isolate Hart1]